jgi:hypothetical protein
MPLSRWITMARNPFSVPLAVIGGGGVVLAAAVAFLGAPSTSTEQKADKRPAKSLEATDEGPAVDVAASEAYGEAPLAPLYHFLGVNKNPDRQAELNELAARIRGYKVRCLIATIPHPTKSGFGYWYDLSLDAIERAVEQAGYVPDRAWIPPAWRKPATTDAKSPAVGKQTTGERAGMLLFRAVDEQKLCIVWLVAETPTSGIEKGAFKEAASLCERFRQGPQVDLRILGPFFSGSQPSLVAVLGEILDDAAVPLSITIRTGGATAIRPENFDHITIGFPWRLSVMEGAEMLLGAGGGQTPKLAAVVHRIMARPIDYQTTVIPEKVLHQQLLRYLDNPSYPGKGDRPIKVAVLLESDTGFGANSGEDRGFGPNCDEDRLPQPKGSTDSANKDADESLIPFPIHISGLQGAHNKELRDQVKQLGLPQPSGPPIPQEEGEKEGEARTLVPTQSPITTAAMNELVMRNVLNSLRREGINYVELVATDPRDKILLATLVRDCCPDVQIFTTSEDFILAHPDYSAALRGTIIGSSYPGDALALSSFSSGETTTARLPRQLFANQNFQGCYNAVLSLLDDGQGKLTRKMLGYCPPHKSNGWEYPDVWISVVGQNGAITPVYKVPIDDDLEKAFAENRVVKRVSSLGDCNGSLGSGAGAPARFSTLFLCGLFLVSAWLGVFLFRDMAAFSRVDDEQPSPRVVPRAEGIKRLCLAALCLCPACLYAWLFALATMPISPDRMSAVINWLVLIVAAVMWLALSYFFVRMCVATARNFRRCCYIILAFLFLVVTAGIIANRYLFDDPANLFLYFDRVTHIASGLSPLLPAAAIILCLAGYSYFLFQKTYYAQYHAVRNPFKLIPPVQAFYELRQLGSNVRRIVESPLLRANNALRATRWLTLAFPALVLTVVFVHLYSRWIPTIEGRLFDVLMFAGLCLCAALTVYVSLHFYAVWSRLRELLKELAKLPLPKAFNRLPETVRAIIDGALYANRPGHSALDLVRQQLQLLAVTLPANALRSDLPFQGRTKINSLETILLKAKALPQTTAGLTGSQIDEMNGVLHETFEAVLPILDVVWQHRSLSEKYALPPVGEAVAKAEFDKAPTADLTPAQVWLNGAEDFVAMEITRYLSQFFAQLRNLLNAIVLGSFLMLLAISVYPFHPQSLLLLYVVILLTAVAALALWVLVAINRDEVMSHISGSTPNQFSPDLTFFKQVGQYVVPIVGLLAVQFQSVGSFLRSMLEPLLRMMH